MYTQARVCLHKIHHPCLMRGRVNSSEKWGEAKSNFVNLASILSKSTPQNIYSSMHFSDRIHVTLSSSIDSYTRPVIPYRSQNEHYSTNDLDQWLEIQLSARSTFLMSCLYVWIYQHSCTGSKKCQVSTEAVLVVTIIVMHAWWQEWTSILGGRETCDNAPTYPPHTHTHTHAQ